MSGVDTSLRTANENNRLARPITRVIALLALSVLINYIDLRQPLPSPHRC